VAVVLLVLPGASASPASIVLFSGAAFVLVATCRELWRAAMLRRAATHEHPVVALRSVILRNRRRYGGYLVHIGMAVIFVGVGASSAFQHISELQLTPGRSASVDGYKLRYVRPTGSVTAQKVDLGAVVDVSKNGHHVTTLTPQMGYYPLINSGLGPVGTYMDGNAESAIGLSAGLRRDIWTSVDPNLDSLQSDIAGIDKRFPKAGGSTQLVLLSLIAARYTSKPPPATFRFIVSPLVEWIWLGGGIAGAGGLLALAPGLSSRRRAQRVKRPVGVTGPSVPVGDAVPIPETVAG
jgi:cytochrome c-type biogenesis protein CcmF